MLEQILKVPDKVLEQNDISNQLNQYYNELPVLSYKEVKIHLICYFYYLII
ncbi:hypothetical protein Q5M85_05605 [Paraclostridium bifermentans]|nr:hypothetical protein [Paraclostridium bifermentans]